MKKRFLVMAMAGLALAGCVSEDVSDVKQKDEKVKIAFDKPITYNNNISTRANYHGEVGGHQYTTGGIVYSYPRIENFMIYAVQHSGVYATWTGAGVNEAGFNNTIVSYDQSVDGWAPKSSGSYYFWEDGMLLSYAACSPADLAQAQDWNGRSYAATGLQITNFKVPTDASKQFDLMYSPRELNKSKADMNHTANYYSGLPITFKHILSSIRFSLSNKSGYPVVLKKISLYGVKEVGTFNENITDGAYYTASPQWNVADDASTVQSTSPYVAFNGEITFPEEAQYVSSLADNSDQVNQLLLLPQTLTDNAVVEIQYTVNGVSNTKIVKLNTALKKNNESEAITNETIQTWDLGTRYTYRLYYSAEAASQDKIYFSPKSDGWTDAGVAVIDLSGITSATPDDDE